MHRNLYVVISLVLGMLFSIASSAEVYKTVDKNGRITYTDVPPADTQAKPIELKTINNIPAPAVINTDNLNNTNNKPQEAAGYRVQIIAPENGKTLMADERSITVSVSTNQNLQDGDLFAYKLDGATLTTSSEMEYIIVEPPRGEHTLTVDIVDNQGNNLAQSNAITVVVMRPLVKPKAPPVPKK
jgi:hypothetical protein